MDVSQTTAPKSDQQNFDDYAAGPKTVTIERVTPGSSEQPVEIHLVEFPGRPYKPNKSMRRVLVAAWGPESSPWAGRRMTLAGDPTVKFGGSTVGGIKIAALSHIDKRISVNLTVTRGKRAPFVVEPLPDAPVDTRPDPRLMDRMVAAFTQLGIADKGARLDYCRNLIGRDIASAGELTGLEVADVVKALEADAQDQTAGQ